MFQLHQPSRKEQKRFDQKDLGTGVILGVQNATSTPEVAIFESFLLREMCSISIPDLLGIECLKKTRDSQIVSA